ncbi:LytR/AlgR family response regulator transcription factor [Ligilactobacillus apodemi]|uniref:LytR/AlgR family response regulator transcription factor n=1 Tax=Ligilactobacillus apodemi TaxID=307126 RepID=UPI000469D28C|nr:LytTR family transcriptional regulator DNA-binding domain-containing protein [Ligilactobacillus apodemi]MCR1901743.1 LytTR family transcriptional regulator DNA-binding domain-containing protein [Ligilactobacillus apodemi]
MKYNVLLLVEKAFQKMFTVLMDVAIMIQAETIQNKLEVGGSFNSSDDLLDFVTKQGVIYGIYILEIELLEKNNGLDVAEQILKVDQNAQIIFVTRFNTSANYVFFRRIPALDCIVVERIGDDALQKRLNDTLELAVKKLDLIDQSPQIIFNYQVGRETYYENLDNVIYITTHNHKPHRLCVYLLNNTVDITGNLQNLLDRYPTLKRISQSCIINLRNVKSVDFRNHKIMFRNGDVEYFPARTNYKIRNLLKDFTNSDK